MSDLKLGFGPSPRPTYIYLNPEHSDFGWYEWDKANDKPIPINEPALTGFVTQVDTGAKAFKGKDNKKLHVHVAAGARNYIVETGFYTASAKCMLAAFAKLRPEQFKNPLALEARPGDEKAVFIQVYDASNGEQVELDQKKVFQSLSNEDAMDRLFERVRTTFQERVGGTASTAEPTGEQPEEEAIEARASAPASNAPARETRRSNAPVVEEEPVSALDNLDAEDHDAVIEYIRAAGPKTPDDATFEYNGKPEKLKPFVRKNWNNVKDDFALAVEIAKALESASKIAFEVPAHA